MEQNLAIIISSVKDGDEAAFVQLAETYNALIKASVSRFRPSFEKISEGMTDQEDIEQIARMALYKAAVRYRGGSGEEYDGVTFGLFAKICINNSLISVLREQKNRYARVRKRSDLFSGALGAEEEIPDDFTQRVDSALSRYEKQVLECFISGKSVRETADFLDKTPKSVSNALYRLKAKLKGLFTN